MSTVRKDFQVVTSLVLGTILVLAKIVGGRWGPIELMLYGFIGAAVFYVIVAAISVPIVKLADMAWASKRAKDEQRYQDDKTTEIYASLNRKYKRGALSEAQYHRAVPRAHRMYDSNRKKIKSTN